MVQPQKNGALLSVVMWLVDMQPSKPDQPLALAAYPGKPVQGQMPPSSWTLLYLTKMWFLKLQTH